jgi:prolyl-tRNA synthetase
MKQSQFFAPTLKQVKSDNPGHSYLLRGGFIRRLAAGIYSYLPLGWRVLRKIENIIREEMDRAGALEIVMPVLHPQELWAETGRDKLDILFRLNDRKETPFVLGPTHEEVVTDIVRSGISSYKQVPVNLYQIQTKFRDEERPRGGLLRGREFVMKDAYSFDRDINGLNASFDKMVVAYQNIFNRCALDAKMIEAYGGGIGGFDTREFAAPAPSGEDIMLYCEADGYAANLETATSIIDPVENRSDISDQLEEFATPGVITIEQLEQFKGGAPAAHQIKTLVYVADGEIVIALLRGDHQLNEAKLSTALTAGEIRAANEEEIVELLGAHPGSLGAVKVTGVKVLSDLALQGRHHMTTGANKDGFHIRGVDISRDIEVTDWVDLRTANVGEKSPLGGGELQETACIELAHIFKLGNKYTKAMNATFLDENGKAQIFEMGCYGIGVSRILAAIAETHHDDRGLIWPDSVAPFDVHVLALDKNPELKADAEKVYEELKAAGFDVLLDDRNERPGVKFAEADLCGIPRRVVLGKKYIESGEVEVRRMGGDESTFVKLDDVVNVLEKL